MCAIQKQQQQVKFFVYYSQNSVLPIYVYQSRKKVFVRRMVQWQNSGSKPVVRRSPDDSWKTNSRSVEQLMNWFYFLKNPGAYLLFFFSVRGLQWFLGRKKGSTVKKRLRTTVVESYDWRCQRHLWNQFSLSISC